MKEIEAYEKQLMTTGVSFGKTINTNRIVKCGGLDCANCSFYRKELNCGCGVRAMEWLLSEHKEPILDDTEREYLSAVIKPFRNKIKYFIKFRYDEFEVIAIRVPNVYFYKDIVLPEFKMGTMYKGMEPNKKYTVEELGL